MGRVPVFAALLCLLLASGGARAGDGPALGTAAQMMRYMYGSIWPQDFRPQGVQLNADLTCDGVADWLFAWRDGVNPERALFNVALAAVPAGAETAGWARYDGLDAGLLALAVDVGTGGQYALCDNPREPYGSGYRTTLEEIPAGVRKRFALPAGCKRWLRIDDGMCDALWVGYDPAQQKFILDRN